VEVLGIAFGGYVAWNPYVQDHIDCERDNRVKQAIRAYVISVIVILTIVAILFLIYFDPLGLQTPSLLTELHFMQNDDNDNEEDKNISIKAKKFGQQQSGGEDDNTVVDETNNTRLYSASSRRQWAQRVRTLCCCVSGRNNRAKVKALEDIAHAMATMFHKVDVVLSDFVVALMLVHRDQKKKMSSQTFDLAADLRNVSYNCNCHFLCT